MKRFAWLGVLLVMASCGWDSTQPVVASMSAVATGVPAQAGDTFVTAAGTIPPCSNLRVLDSWSLSRRAAQLIVVPVGESHVGGVAPAVQIGAGGIILFGSAAPSNLAAQLGSLVAQAPAGIAPLVMTDEEGGGVQRMANLVGYLPWPATMAATLSPASVRQLTAGVARRMAADGVTVDLAPVLDLASGPGPDAIHTDGPRSFSPAPSLATAYGMAFAQGLLDGGVQPVVKHFPGEGRASANTDYRPGVTPPIASLERQDLIPFEAAVRAGLPIVMVGNDIIPGLTAKPASISPAAINGLLRNQLGFQGLVLTDTLSAAAISALGIGVPQAAESAIAAGADMVLYSSSNPNLTFRLVLDRLVSAVNQGRISVSALNTAVARVLTVKRVNLCPPAVT